MIVVWSVLDSGSEDSDLTEKHRDQEGGAGGVVGGGEDKGDPRGDREQECRYEVGEHEVTILAGQIYVQTNNGVFMLAGIRVLSRGVIALEILHSDMVSR